MSSPLSHWVSNPQETNGPVISIATATLCAFATLFLGLRLYIRISKGKFWTDDALLLAGWACLVTEVTMVQLMVSLGFGKHALDVKPSSLNLITYYGESKLTLSILAINLSKISFAVTLIRLTKDTDEWIKRFCWFAIATLVVFGIPVAIIPWVQCRPLIKTFVDFWPGECMDKRPSVIFGVFQAAWAGLMDVCLALIPWSILWPLQMRTTEKIGACVAMSLGIIAGGTAIARAVTLPQLAKQDMSYDAAGSIIWSTAESSATIIAISIPVLRAFISIKVNTAVAAYRGTRSGGTSSGNQRTDGSRGTVVENIHLSSKVSGRDMDTSRGSMSDPLSKTPSTWLSLDDSAEDVSDVDHRRTGHRLSTHAI